jgi:hypothetical protein
LSRSPEHIRLIFVCRWHEHIWLIVRTLSSDPETKLKYLTRNVTIKVTISNSSSKAILYLYKLLSRLSLISCIDLFTNFYFACLYFCDFCNELLAPFVCLFYAQCCTFNVLRSQICKYTAPITVTIILTIEYR